ncbi:E3 ubiquitin-protein ligase LNX [Cichlidogyrus casuarinus]|uniref:E3 ubiquitin-protein ligase LNX n=1 Tax=Cichlidogyrus casuarinus TaxID=1844966 RepID=A0ABD2Q6T9_9PLAT
MARLALAAPSLPSECSDSATSMLKQFRLMVYRERNGSESVSPRVGFNLSTSEKLSLEREEILRVTLRNRPGIKLGIKLAVKKNQPGLYILGIIPDGEAHMDGRLKKDDRILEINNYDLRDGTQEHAVEIIRNCTESVSFLIQRLVRPQTPDIIRTTSGEEHVPSSSRKDIVPRPPSSAEGVSSTASVSTSATPPPSSSTSASNPVGFISKVHLKPIIMRPCREVEIVITKRVDESLGMSVAGGLASQRGDTPVYVTNFDPSYPVGRSGKISRGDILLSVNGVDLLGLSHEQAVESLKSCRQTPSCADPNSMHQIRMRFLEGPETSTDDGNFLPTWVYWLQLPAYCQIPKLIGLRRSSNGSLGFYIVGGHEFYRGSSDSNSSVQQVNQLIVIKSIVPDSPAFRNGQLK